MTITYPLSLPAVKGIATIRVVARNVTAISRSPFALSAQVYRWSGQAWEADITLPAMQRADAESWLSFLLKLKGRYGTFLLGDPNGATPRGSAATTPGTPLVAGGAQVGGSLDIDGLPLSATNYLLAGDYIQLGTGLSTRLYKVLNNVSSNGSGQATLDLWPDLRSSPGDNATVVVSNAKGLFRLSNPDQDFTIDDTSTYNITFGAMEAI
jgi:hypothetical protein|uniref:hypothetical protein n=1 Tax=Polynucleobacter sp. TaxID=2029855 RepID=UPI004048B747